MNEEKGKFAICIKDQKANLKYILRHPCLGYKSHVLEKGTEKQMNNFTTTAIDKLQRRVTSLTFLLLLSFIKTKHAYALIFPFGFYTQISFKAPCLIKGSRLPCLQ